VVVYQVYPRSFQDSDGDGVGDLAGVRARLDHLAWLGVDALWLSPIYPSPMADFGYDVSDYTDVDPVFGDLAEFDRLAEAAHQRGLKLLMDVVPCHTSIEHPWFREHPDWYIWADRPNNWVAAFGGSAWEPRPEAAGSAGCAGYGFGRYYLHSFYPEQPDLDWRNPEVVAAMQDVLRFWLERGADGYRIDAIDRLMKDPDLRDDPPASEPYGLPLREDEAKLALSNSRNGPGTGAALARMREAVGDAFLVGEVYLPSARWQPYSDHFDAVFAFELLLTSWDAGLLNAAIDACTKVSGQPAWVMSNHDFGRLATRFGRENARAAAMMLLTLPGPAFLYQGDEIAQGDGPPGEKTRFDRAGRDRFRHPMQWDGSPHGGFSTAEPWLPAVDPAERNVEAQRDDPDSALALMRELIALRRELGDGFELLDAAGGVVAYRRGEHTVAVNTTAEPRPVPLRGDPPLETAPGALRDGELAPHAGAIAWD
jgi:alpha-glucosidase